MSVATAIASVPAGIVAQWADGSTILRGGVVWWIGDMLAYAVVTPLVVLSFHPPRFPIRRWTVARLLEASALAAISMAMAVFAFRGTRLIGPLEAQPYMLILPVLLVTLRFGQLGTLWTLLGIGVPGVLLLVDNQPAALSISAGGDALTIHQTFLGIQAVVGLVLSTALREQEETAVEHARTVEALTASEQRLRQSQKMEAIGQLAGGIAHDFNNVLAAILMQLEELRLVRDLPRVGRELLVDVETAVQRAARLTRQLLVFSRQQAMQPRVLDLNILVRSHVRLLRRVVPSSYSLVVSSAPAPLVVEVDGGMVEQVLMNLVLNARDAQRSGGAIVITTMARTLPPDSPSGLPPGNYAVLSVRDTGSGIPEDHLPRLFEPFFTTKPTGQGTGLGLATVYGIVQQHGGTVRVETTLGLGTTMEVWLPASSEALPEQATGATDDISPDSGEHRAPVPFCSWKTSRRSSVCCSACCSARVSGARQLERPGCARTLAAYRSHHRHGHHRSGDARWCERHATGPGAAPARSVAAHRLHQRLRPGIRSVRRHHDSRREFRPQARPERGTAVGGSASTGPAGTRHGDGMIRTPLRTGRQWCISFRNIPRRFPAAPMLPVPYC